MRFHQEADRSRYDAVVIGSGMAGLTSAALLARAGRSVLLVERHDRVGGYAHGFRRGRHRFDSAVHVVGGGDAGRDPGRHLIDRVLGTLGVRDRCELIRVDPFYTVCLPDLELRVPSGLDEFADVHVERFASEEKGIREFLGECVGIRAEAHRAAGVVRATDLSRFTLLRRYRRAVLSDVLNVHVEDPQAAAALGALWPYVGLPPSRVSFLYYATMLMSYVADGAYYCRGTFQNLADALATALRQNGGEVLLRSTVRRITVREGRAAGIVLENGQQIEAPLVVSNADADQTIHELVGANHLPAARSARMARLDPSISAFVVYGTTTLDLAGAGLGHETFLYAAGDHDTAWRDVLAREPSFVTLTAPAHADREQLRHGEQPFAITTLAPYAPADRWRSEKAAFQERMIDRVERRLPGFRASIGFVESATPRTMERYTRNREGAIYGWALTPRQTGPGRPAAETPIPGLLLAGHWTRPGGGVYGVIDSGVTAARIALGSDPLT